MPKYSAGQALHWQLRKNRKRRLALHTALRTVYHRLQLYAPSGMPYRAFVTEQQWSSGLGKRL